MRKLFLYSAILTSTFVAVASEAIAETTPPPPEAITQMQNPVHCVYDNRIYSQGARLIQAEIIPVRAGQQTEPKRMVVECRLTQTGGVWFDVEK